MAVGRWLLTFGLLTGSSTAMTFAWYYHLKKEHWPIYVAIFASWGIAFFEYCLQVPANKYGYVGNGGPFTAPQLKVIAEMLSFAVFSIFSTVVLKNKLYWPDIVAFVMIVAGVAVSLIGKELFFKTAGQPTAAPSTHLMEMMDTSVELRAEPTLQSLSGVSMAQQELSGVGGHQDDDPAQVVLISSRGASAVTHRDPHRVPHSDDDSSLPLLHQAAHARNHHQAMAHEGGAQPGSVGGSSGAQGARGKLQNGTQNALEGAASGSSMGNEVAVVVDRILRHTEEEAGGQNGSVV